MKVGHHGFELYRLIIFLAGVLNFNISREIPTYQHHGILHEFNHAAAGVSTLPFWNSSHQQLMILKDYAG